MIPVLLLAPLLFAADPVAGSAKPPCDGKAAGAECTIEGGGTGACVLEIVDTAKVGPPRWEQTLTCRKPDDTLFRCAKEGDACRALARNRIFRLPGLGGTKRPPAREEVLGLCQSVEAKSAEGLVTGGIVTGLACVPPMVTTTGGSASSTRREKPAKRHAAEEPDPAAERTALVIRLLLGGGGLIAVFLIGRSFFTKSPG